MRVQYMSDLHIEHGNISIAEPAAEILVIAGDVANGGRVVNFLKSVAKQFKTVIFVMGNHEYYSYVLGYENMKDRINEYRSVLPDNVALLDNEYMIVEDKVIYGGTMWVPLDTKEKRHIAINSLNDFKFVNYFDVQDSNKEFHNNFTRAADLVISHHVPSMQSIELKYIGSKLTSAGYVDSQAMQHFGEKAKVWIHGHTHSSSDYELYGTRVLANPRGYARDGHSENSKFNIDATVEI